MPDYALCANPGRARCRQTALVHEYGLGCASPRLHVLFDTDRDRHAEAGHLVEGVAGDFGFGLLIGQSPSLQTPTDDGLVAIHRRLDEAPPAIARATLPADAAVLLDRTQMVIALRRAGLAQNGGRARRDDHPRRRGGGEHPLVDPLARRGGLRGGP